MTEYQTSVTNGQSGVPTTAQPINFRNSNNTLTYASILASKITGSNIPTDAGILDFTGKTTADPCYLKNARLLPNFLAGTSTLTLNILLNNNHHITTSVNITTINLTNQVMGQSGHIIIKNSSALAHSVAWQVNSNTGYVKWQGGTAPTLSTTASSYDIISYYCFSTTEVLFAASIGH